MLNFFLIVHKNFPKISRELQKFPGNCREMRFTGISRDFPGGISREPALIVIAQNSIWVISITRTHYKSIIRIGWYNFGFRTAEIIAQLLLFLLIVIAIKSESSVSNKRFLVFQVSYPRPFFEVIRPENVETFDEATQWLKITWNVSSKSLGAIFAIFGAKIQICIRKK